jgi:hypothetical protein
MNAIPTTQTFTVDRLRRSVSARVSSIAAHPLLNGAAAHELWTELLGGHAVADDQSHLREAISWLVRAQDATPDGGISRGFSLARHPEFGAAGWQPSYPETTGYIVPTLYAAAQLLESPTLAARASLAAHWEIDVQLPSGAVRGGTMKAPPSPAVFNTGQVMLGWLAALEHGGNRECADAVHRAAEFLLSVQDRDGAWRRGQSNFADAKATMYNTRTAWALAEAGVRLNRPAYRDAALRALRAAAYQQHRNGWIPECCLSDPERPLLHTIAYAISGLVEGGRVLEDEELVNAGARAARSIARIVSPEGWLPGRLAADWSAAVDWSCLTGEAQMVNVWFRLHDITGDNEWLEPVPRVISYLKATQDRSTRNQGRRGGIKGAMPVTGDYGRLEVLSWATKFFADMLMRSMCFYGRKRQPVSLLLA